MSYVAMGAVSTAAAQAAAAAAHAASSASLANARAMADRYSMSSNYSSLIQTPGLAHGQMLLLAAAACASAPCDRANMHQRYYDAQLCTEIVAEYTRVHMPGSPQAALADAAWHAAVFTQGGDAQRLAALNSAACDLFRAARL